MQRGAFEKLVAQGVARIPKKFLEKLENVAIVVEGEPDEAQAKKLKLKKDSALFGLYEGVPQSKRGPGYGMTVPDKITIFQKPIEEYANSDEEVQKIVYDTVWHEIAHHFGFDEKGVRRAQKKRQR